MKKILFVMVFAAALVAPFSTAFADEDVQTSVTSLHKKVDQVLANQDKILAQLDALADEINVVKIRATR